MSNKDSRITKADIEEKLREIEQGVEDSANAAKPAFLATATTFLATFAGISYALGARKGKKLKTIVEVKRV